MTVHLQLDISDLHRELLAMCGRVEDLIHRAVEQLPAANLEECQNIIKADNEIDRMDVRIEDLCLKVLALHQPVAIDLRRITTVMKISAELERVADLAANISERACGLLENPEVQIPDLVSEMADKAIAMLHHSIDAYVDLNSELARQVCQEDDEIDKMNKQVIDQLITFMHNAPDQLDALLHLFSASRQIERVADHATNIAEDVVYLVEGSIIRHATSLENQAP